MRWAGVSFLLVLLLACGKDHSGIPDVAVNFRKPIDNPVLAPLKVSGGLVEIEGYGVAGLIIYRSAFSGIKAYDRCSTVNPEKRCKVEVNETNSLATDPCSGAVFSLEDGSPAKPPAKKALKQYSAVISNGYLIVVN